MDERRKGRSPTLPATPFSGLAPNIPGEVALELISLTCLFKLVLGCEMSDLVGTAVDKLSPLAAENILMTGLIGLTSGCLAIERAGVIGDEPVTGWPDMDGAVTGVENIVSMAIGFLEVSSEPKDTLETVL